MHLHSFDCSLCTIVLISIVLAVALTRYDSHMPCNGLLTIIEGFHHASLIGWSLWQQEVVLEDSASPAEYTLTTTAVALWVASSDLWSCALHVLHEAALCFSHMVLRWCVFVWIIKSRSRSIWACAKATGIQILVLLHQNYAIILETLIKAYIVARNWTTTARKFASIANFSVGLV